MDTEGEGEAGTNREIRIDLHMLLGFPGGAVVKNLPPMQEMQVMWVQSLG